jgi:hypothetical protein
MHVQPSDRFTPAAVGLVSRAWIIREVSRQAADPALQRRWVDQLFEYEPPRKNGLRNNFIFWISALSAATLAGAAGIAPWIGFIAALIAFLGLARLLAVRALQWRLRQLVAESHGVRTDSQR